MYWVVFLILDDDDDDDDDVRRDTDFLRLFTEPTCHMVSRC